ncbi:MAG: hypothetical protein ACI4GZ_03135 [Ruminococcus sp.]
MTEYIIPNSRNTGVYIDGMPLMGVSSVLGDEVAEYYIRRELLQAETEKIRIGKKHNLKLAFSLPSETIEKAAEGFTVTVKTPAQTKNYERCKVAQVRESVLPAGKYLKEYTLEAEELFTVPIGGNSNG